MKVEIKMKKRSVIVTFFDEINYGAVFQSYALQSKLKEYTDEVCILDYQPSIMKLKKRIINTASMKSMLLSLITLSSSLRRKQIFKSFISKYLSVKTVRQCCEGDTETYVFLGSDQIWNPRITAGVDPIFYGQIPGMTQKKTIAYAPSFGIKELSIEEKEAVGAMLKGIDLISVRENEGKDILVQLTDDEISVVCDPTILVGRQLWDEVKISPKEEGKYIFVYSLSQNPMIDTIAHHIAHEKGIPIVEAYLVKKPKRSTNTHRVIDDVRPEQFIGWLDKAEYVVTDSFHGTVFSLLYNKVFYSVPFVGKEGRIKNLLEIVGLSSRIANSESDIHIEDKIDYARVEEALQRYRTVSENYIERGISL